MQAVTRLITCVMLFVDNQKGNLLKARKNRHPGSHKNTGPPFVHGKPVGGPLF